MGDERLPGTWWQDRTTLTRAGVAALVAATVAALLAVLVFLATVDDVVGHDGMTRHDPSRLHWFVSHRGHLVVSGSRLVTLIGDPPVLILLALLATAWLWRRGEHLVVASAPCLALAGSATAVAVLKAAVHRPRPPVSLHLISENAASFPSGHATDSTALFVTLGLILAVVVVEARLARIATVIASSVLAGAIGLSRLVLGVHWPSDVIAGWSLGLLVAVSVATAATLLVRVGPPSADERSYPRPVALLVRRRGGEGPPPHRQPAVRYTDA